MQQPFAINRIQIYENGQAIPDSLVVIDQGKILFAGRPEDAPGLDAMQMIDGRGLSVAPGYIDLQFNGGYGQDFTANPASLLDVAKHLPGTGVVAFLPTFITSPLEAYPEILQEVIKAQAFQDRASNSSARILGAHIEGPFLNPNKKGAHPQDLFRDPLPAALAYFEPLEVVRLLTLAPERTGALDAIGRLTQQGIIVSIGHSAAGEHETLEAISAGASYATHLYNAMRSMQHRDPGLVGTLLTSNEVTCGLIVDGIHVHPRMVKLAYRCLGDKRITLVTDAMAAMGMPPGQYNIGKQRVIVENNTARLEDGTLAGSILRMDEAVRNMVAFSGCTPAEAVRMASTTPAEVLGIDGSTGHILPGYSADLVILDDNLHVLETYIAGEPV